MRIRLQNKWYEIECEVNVPGEGKFLFLNVFDFVPIERVMKFDKGGWSNNTKWQKFNYAHWIWTNAKSIASEFYRCKCVRESFSIRLKFPFHCPKCELTSMDSNCLIDSSFTAAIWVDNCHFEIDTFRLKNKELQRFWSIFFLSRLFLSWKMLDDSLILFSCWELVLAMESNEAAHT